MSSSAEKVFRNGRLHPRRGEKKNKKGKEENGKPKDSICRFLFSNARSDHVQAAIGAPEKDPREAIDLWPDEKIGRYGWEIPLEVLEILIKLEPVRRMKNIRGL